VQLVRKELPVEIPWAEGPQVNNCDPILLKVVGKGTTLSPKPGGAAPPPWPVVGIVPPLQSATTWKIASPLARDGTVEDRPDGRRIGVLGVEGTCLKAEQKKIEGRRIDCPNPHPYPPFF
jgi:hypothetical protein